VLGPRERLIIREDYQYNSGPPLFGAYGVPRNRSGWKRLLAWASFTTAAIALGAVLGFQYSGGVLPAPILKTVAPSPSPSNPYSAGLSVEQQEAGLLVRWDVNAPVLQAAQQGLLLVSEKNGSKEVKLGYAELRSGTVIYRSIPPEVTFRLELSFPENRTFVESKVWRAPVGAAEIPGAAPRRTLP
jgi:hypothetical protein